MPILAPPRPRALRRAVVAVCVAAATIASGCSGRAIRAGDASAFDGTPDHRRTDAVRTDRGQDMDGLRPDASGVHCDPSGAMCEMMPGPCPYGQIHSVVGACWGPCVEVKQCRPVQCDTALVTCKMAQPSCDGEELISVPVVRDTCWGPCVPIDICACEPNGPRSQCPRDGFVCHAYRHACGPLD